MIISHSADVCSICLQPKTSNQDISSLISCSHKFHKHCIKQWLSITKHPTCPICRDLTSIEVIDDTEWIPPNYNANIKINVRKSKRIQRKMKWKTKKCIYECSQCMQTFKEKTSLIEHERRHNKQRKQPYNYKCGHCNYYDLFKESFESHNIIEHDEWKPHHCGRCKKHFTKSQHLNEHIRSIHWKVRNYTCNVCDASFYHKGNFTRHSRTHSLKKPFKCKSCGRGFNDASNLMQHQVVHSSHQKFKCNVCGKKYKRKRNLREHQTIHANGADFQCYICRKLFKDRSSLCKHQKKCL